MKKITIITAVAGVLALAPLMTGCGVEAEGDDNVIDDISEEEDGEEGEFEDGSGDGAEIEE